MAPDLTIVGRRIGAVDGPSKVTGEARFTDDLKVPGMLHGKILRSPLPHARILNIDASRALRLRGVRAVVTAADTPGKPFGQGSLKDMYVLATGKVRYVGEEVAAVAAVDRDTAEEALDLIKVDYEPLPAVFSPAEAMAKGAPLVHEGYERNICRSIRIVRGDVEEGFRQAHAIFEQTISTPSVYHGYLEPSGAIASFDSSGRVTCWVGSQGPHRAKSYYAEALGLEESQVRVVQSHVGGAFGGKSFQTVLPITMALARKAGRPVKIVNTREEEMFAARPRMPATIWVKLGVDREGLITARQVHVVGDTGASGSMGVAVISTTCTRSDSLYRYKNMLTTADLVYTNRIPIGPYRGYGSPQIHFAVETALDQIAEQIGMDPVELRLRNATQKGDVSIHGWLIKSCGFSECLVEAARGIGLWGAAETRRRGDTETRRPGDGGRFRRGKGLACCLHVSGNHASCPYYDGSAAWVRVGADGKIQVVSGEVDVGQGASTVFAQICAEELGVPIESISIAPVDTDLSPFGLGSFASRVTLLGGGAVKRAAAEAKKLLLQTAAEKLEVAEEDLEVRDGKVQVKGSPDRALTVADVALTYLYKHAGEPILGKAFFIPPDIVPPSRDHYGNVSAAYSFAVHAAEVEVDTETGHVRVLRFFCANDIGRAVNPSLSESQVEGAVVQAQGYAVTEAARLDQTGRLANGNYREYGLPTAVDAPAVAVALIETNDPVGPFGAKEVGEVSIVAGAPAIANAIYDAVGVRLRDLPFTPEKVLAALRGEL